MVSVTLTICVRNTDPSGTIGVDSGAESPGGRTAQASRITCRAVATGGSTGPRETSTAGLLPTSRSSVPRNSLIFQDVLLCNRNGLAGDARLCILAEANGLVLL